MLAPEVAGTAKQLVLIGRDTGHGFQARFEVVCAAWVGHAVASSFSAVIPNSLNGSRPRVVVKG